jgi:hypothetical protein
MKNLFVLLLLFLTGEGSADVYKAILERASRRITTRTSLKQGRKKYTTEHEELVKDVVASFPGEYLNDLHEVLLRLLTELGLDPMSRGSFSGRACVLRRDLARSTTTSNLISEVPDDHRVLETAPECERTDVSEVLKNGISPSEKRRRLEATDTLGSGPTFKNIDGRGLGMSGSSDSRQESSERTPTIDNVNRRVSDPSISESQQSVPSNITDSIPLPSMRGGARGFKDRSTFVSAREMEDEDSLWRDIALSLSERQDEKIVAITGNKDADDDVGFWREIYLALSDHSDDNNSAAGI